MQPITTSRLTLVPATLALLDADLDSPQALARLLGAEVPADWPPGEYDRPAMQFFREQLAARPDAVGWYGWYALYRAPESTRPVLVGCGGYMGPPDAAGVAEIGYSLVTAFRGLGFATELVNALVSRAFSVPGLRQVIAHTTTANIGSVGVLERCGFSRVGPGRQPDTVRYAASPRRT